PSTIGRETAPAKALTRTRVQYSGRSRWPENPRQCWAAPGGLDAPARSTAPAPPAGINPPAARRNADSGRSGAPKAKAPRWGLAPARRSSAGESCFNFRTPAPQEQATLRSPGDCAKPADSEKAPDPSRGRGEWKIG